MAIIKSAILTEVNKRTARAETDIDSLLKAILLDLTIDFPFWRKTRQVDTSAGKSDYALLDTERIVEMAKIDDKAPLIRINTWQEYQEFIAEETESNWEEPKRWIVHNRILYVHPTPDEVYALTIFSSYIEMDADSIGLDDTFEELLTTGCEFMLYRSKGLGTSPQAILAMKLYENQKDQLKRIHSEAGGKVEYSDI